MNRYRTLPVALRGVSALLLIAAVSSAIVSAFHFSPFGLVLFERTYHYLLLALFLPHIFLWIPVKAGSDSRLLLVVDGVLALLAFAVCGFLSLNAKVIIFKWGIFPPIEGTILAFILWGLLVEAARRSVGPIFAVIFVLLSLFPLYSEFLPAPFWAPTNVGLVDLAHFYIFGSDGLMGIVVQVFGSVLIGFLVYAVAIQVAGAGEFFSIVAARVFGSARGGAAKTAITSSGLLGSVSGSPIANVLTTGAFTIPAMKKSGFPPHLAGAVEASASTGGTVLPPIMGAVAFLMAQFLETSYADIALLAFVPALMYYTVLYVQIDLFSARAGLKGVESWDGSDEHRGIGRALIDYWHLIGSLAVLIFVLFGLRLEIQAPWYATAALIVFSLARRKTRFNYGRLLNLLEDGARVIGETVGILAPLGLIIAAFIVNGVSQALPYDIVKIAGDSIILLLLLGGLAALVLGMGVSLVATYVFLAIVLAPGLVDAGIDKIAAHFFILYSGLWAHLTPPVAIVAFTAARVAGAAPFQTAFAAMRLGMAKYVLPFAIALKPALIFREASVGEILWTTSLAMVGLVIMSIGMEGYCWKIGRLSPILRTLFCASGLVLVFGNMTWQISGVGVFLLSLTGAWLLRPVAAKSAG